MLIKKIKNINVFKCVIYFFSCLDRIEILFIAKNKQKTKKTFSTVNTCYKNKL